MSPYGNRRNPTLLDLQTQVRLPHAFAGHMEGTFIGNRMRQQDTWNGSLVLVILCRANTKHLYSAGPTSSTLANIAEMLYKCFVFAGVSTTIFVYDLSHAGDSTRTLSCTLFLDEGRFFLQIVLTEAA